MNQEINKDSDVEVRKKSGSYHIRVDGMCKYPVTFHKPIDALNALIAVREAGHKVPKDVIKELAEKVTKKLFDQPDDML